MAVALHNIAEINNSLGNYDKALVQFKKALKINKKLRFKAEAANNLNGIGTVYNEWARYDDALRYYRKAIAIDRKLGRKEREAIRLHNIGQVFSMQKKYKKALAYSMQALQIEKKLGLKDSLAVNLVNIGLIYHNMKQVKKAVSFYEQAFVVARKLGQKNKLADVYRHMTDIHLYSKKYKKALKFARAAVKINRALGRKDPLARSYEALAFSQFSMGNYERAGAFLKKAVSIFENLRATAPGKIKRDYFTTLVHTYQSLATARLAQKRPDLALQAIEQSRARYFLDVLADKTKSKIGFTSLKDVQKQLPDSTIVVSFAKINWDESLRLVMDNQTISGYFVYNKTFIKGINLKHGKKIRQAVTKLRGVKLTTIAKRVTGTKKNEKKLENIINYYRHLLTRQNRTKQELKEFKEISKKIYRFLFKGIEKHLKGKKELIIIPDGILAFLPFESLVMPDGRYLVEKYNIRYTQSLTVSSILNQRRYKKDRKSFLAFGGAVYKKAKQERPSIKSEHQMKAFKNTVTLLSTRGSVMGGQYKKLGIGNWSNLPGTMTEVKRAGSVMAGATIYTGTEASESWIKTLSEKDLLSRYKVIHFATHGLVVPQVPELSALVFSQLKGRMRGEDGYLRMPEIAKLKLNADFVNLSACETGLGKIFGGEGVVGLTQSFLIAGANSISVSLWQVADASTMQFMTGMYEAVENSNLTYLKAMNKMKRAFIRGDFGRKFKDPFYWAPFVFYGKK